MAHSNYLCFLRKRAALSQDELAHIIGDVDRSTISRYESGEQVPSTEFVLGCLVLFGVGPRELFTGLYESIQERVINNAAEVEQALRGDTSEAAARKRKLLLRMVERAHSPRS